MSEQLNDVRARVLDAVQSGFPLEHDPYGVLGEQLGATREQVLEAVAALREEGIIRRIGASFSSRQLGYTSTLCALAAPGSAEEVDRIASLVSAHSEVTHNYLRNSTLNIWFTVIAPSSDSIDQLLDVIHDETGCDVLSLPATRVYKIRVDFSGTTEASGTAEAPGDANAAPFDPADPFDVAALRVVQEDIGTGEHPFAGLGLDEEKLLARLREWKANGTIRRFGACVRHRKMGYAFNGMSVWDVPRAKIEHVGQCFADYSFVSHCYERPRSDIWPYNLYAMVHGKTQDELDAHLALMRESSGLDCDVLVSNKEYKKISPVYFG